MNSILERIIGTDPIKMEQQVTLDNQSAIKIFALCASIILLYFFTKKYVA
jgi:hypothetical protein